MGWQKFISSVSILTFVVTPAVVLSSVASQVRAQSAESQIALSFPPPPAGLTRPRSSAGGGVRGSDSSCTAEGEMPLTALMPTRDNVATTAAPNPPFFLYVPESTAKSAEFVIVDEAGNEVYLSEFELSGTPGILQVTLPQGAESEKSALKVGEKYQWQFALICDPGDRRADEFVQGEIERTELSANVKDEIEEAEPLEQAKLYAGERIWNETVAILAQLRDSNQKEWEELLQSVGLEEISSEPMLPSNPE